VEPQADEPWEPREHTADVEASEELTVQDLAGLKTRFHEWKTVGECIQHADIIYMEPVVQADYTKSRVNAAEAKKGLKPAAYKVTRELLRKKAKPGVIILHSLPRMDELPPDVDHTRHARYWIEAFNGVVLRMALIALVLGRTE